MAQGWGRIPAPKRACTGGSKSAAPGPKSGERGTGTVVVAVAFPTVRRVIRWTGSRAALRSPPMSTLHDFKIRSIDGSERSLSDLKGKAVLVVNVASQCGLTPQYTGLEELQKTYGDRGFTVLGIPCNQFAGQEPGSEEEIQKFCSMTYGVTFPMTAKVDVNGDSRDPLYGWLTAEITSPDGPGDIKWNFAKFLVGKDGRVLRRYSPMVTPDDAGLREDIEAALA